MMRLTVGWDITNLIPRPGEFQDVFKLKSLKSLVGCLGIFAGEKGVNRKVRDLCSNKRCAAYAAVCAA